MVEQNTGELEFLKTMLKGRKAVKRDEYGRKMTQKGANHGSTEYQLGKSNAYRTNYNHARAFILKRRNAGKGSR